MCAYVCAYVFAYVYVSARVYMCIRVCLCAHAYTCTSEHVHVETGRGSWVASSVTVYLIFFLRQGLSRNLELDKLTTLAGQRAWGPSCLYIPSPGITSAHSWGVFYILGFKLGFSCFCSKHLICPVSHPPQPLNCSAIQDQLR